VVDLTTVVQKKPLIMSSSDEKCKGTKRPASPDEVCDFHHHVFLNWITLQQIWHFGVPEMLADC